MEALGSVLRTEAVLTTLTQDVVKSSKIEGENLNRNQLRSSIARRLGTDIGALPSADRHIEGVVEMMLDATQKGDFDISAWLRWFLECLDRSIAGAERSLASILHQAAF